MFSFQNSVKEKLRLLRKTHNLSTAQLAELLDFKSNGSVGMIETGKAGPTLVTFEKIVQLFAISPNWLLGLDNITKDFFLQSLDWSYNRFYSSPYQEEIIEAIENNLIADRDKDDEWLAYYRLSSWMMREVIYADLEKRTGLFPLCVRANMIYALQVLHHNSIFFHVLQSQALFDGNQLPSEACSYYPAFYHIFYPLTVAHEGKRKANIRWNHCSACYDLLVEYIKGSRNRNEPVFDIRKSD